MSDFLFVYGTLKFNTCPIYHQFSGETEYYSDGHIQGTMFDHGKFPSVILDNSGKKIYGKILKLKNKNVLKIIDDYEGLNTLLSSYDRKIVNVNGIKCWCYVYNKSINNLKIIESGIFTMR